MEQTNRTQLPEVQIYGVDPNETDRVAALFTAEAVEYIKACEAFGLVLVEENEARGAVCARIRPDDGSVLEIISLYVAPAFRRNRLGSTLLLETLERAMRATDDSLRRVTLSFLPETEGLEALLEKTGFRMEKEPAALSLQTTVEKLNGGKLLEYGRTVPAGHILCTLEKVSSYQIRRLTQLLQANGVEFLSQQEIQREAHRKTSQMLFDKDGEPVACAIFTVDRSSWICLAQFFAAEGSSMAALSVLQAGARALIRTFPADTVVEVPALTESSAKLVRRLVADVREVAPVNAVLDLTAAKTGKTS